MKKIMLLKADYFSPKVTNVPLCQIDMILSIMTLSITIKQCFTYYVATWYNCYCECHCVECGYAESRLFWVPRTAMLRDAILSVAILKKWWVPFMLNVVCVECLFVNSLSGIVPRTKIWFNLLRYILDVYCHSVKKLTEFELYLQTADWLILVVCHSSLSNVNLSNKTSYYGVFNWLYILLKSTLMPTHPSKKACIDV